MRNGARICHHRARVHAAIFSAGLVGAIKNNATVTCSTAANATTCDGTATRPNAFAGVPGIGPTTTIKGYAVAYTG